MPGGVRRQRRLHGGPGGLSGDVHLQYLIPPPGKGHKGQGHPSGAVHRALVKTLLPLLVEAPALYAARPSTECPAERLRLRPLVDVAQGQIGEAAGGSLLPADGVIAGLRRVQLAVEKSDVDPSVRRGGEARQEARRLLRSGEGRAVDHQVPLRQFRRRQRMLPENGHVLRPVHRLPGTAGAVPVMVARGDQNSGPHLPQGRRQLLSGLPEGAAAVEQIARQQHQADLIVIDIVRQPKDQLPALPAAGRRLPGRQSAEGAVQMKVGGVDEFEHIASLVTESVPPLSSPCRRPPTPQSWRSTSPAPRRSVRWRCCHCRRRGTRCRTALRTRPGRS